MAHPSPPGIHIGIGDDDRRAIAEPTADLLTQRLAAHEQTAWMLRSLLEE